MIITVPSNDLLLQCPGMTCTQWLDNNMSVEKYKLLKKYIDTPQQKQERWGKNKK